MAYVNPLAAACPDCRSPAGEQCRDDLGEAMRLPHRMRELAAVGGLVRCTGCDGVGWRRLDDEDDS